MTSAQMSEWFWYLDREPVGGRQEDMRAGVVAQAVYAAAGTKVDLGDLFPTLRPERATRRRSGWEHFRETMRALFGKKRKEATSGA